METSSGKDSAWPPFGFSTQADGTLAEDKHEQHVLAIVQRCRVAGLSVAQISSILMEEGTDGAAG